MKGYGTAGVLAAMTIAPPAAAQDAVGDWAGTLEVAAGARLPIIVHIARGEGGGLSATMDSPTQGARGIPVTEVVVDAGKLSFKVPAISGSYSGTWDDAQQAWTGEWSQGGANLPLVLSAPKPPPPLPANWEVPADEDIRRPLEVRNAPRSGQGIVVGVLAPQSSRLIAEGPAGSSAFDGDTLFEIGSISKVFTALILADMANKGEVSLDDPAEAYLPAGHTMPSRNGRKITLRDLSTHMSGLPRLPDNLPFGDLQDPYADYGEDLLLAFLDGYSLPRDIGAQWEYSNLGVGLLGYLLGRAAGSDYETLLRERITGPLGMTSTAVTLTGSLSERLAPPHDEYLRPTKPWALASLVGAGGIRSSGADMLKFAAAALDPQSPIAAAMTTALSVREKMGQGDAEQALGWQIGHPEPTREVVIHNGGTGGFRSTLALDRANRRAAVVLINSGAEPSSTDIAMHLLYGMPVAPTLPVPPAPPPAADRTAVTLPVTELERVTGTYDFGSGVVFVVTRDGDTLRAQRQGSVTGPLLPIFAEAPLRFFWRAVDAQVRFIADEAGEVTGAEFTQSGQAIAGRRVSD